MGEQADGRTNGWENRRAREQADGRTGERENKWTGEQADGRTSGRENKRAREQTGERTVLQTECSAGFDTIGFAAMHEPNVGDGGVVNHFAVCADDEGFVGFDVVIDLDVGGVPDVLFAADVLGEALDDVPVVVVVKLVAVTPDVEKPILRRVARFGGDKLLGKRHQLGVVVMTSGVEGKPILRKSEAERAVYRAGIGDATGIEHLDGLVVKVAVGVRHTARQRAVVFLDALSVRKHLFDHFRGFHFGKKPMLDTVDGDLVPRTAVERERFRALQSAAEFFAHGVLVKIKPRVDVEGCL